MVILKREVQGALALKKAKELESLGRSLIFDECANIILRESLENYLIAYWIIVEKRMDISVSMHSIGKLLHDRFQCPLKFNGKSYYNDCPVRLSHIDIGFSIGCTEDLICSICGKDPLECDHTSGEKYNNIICKEIRNICNICWENKCLCHHIIGETYNGVEAVLIEINIKPNHIAMVSNPADPLCRVTAVPISDEHIASVVKTMPKNLRKKFQYGKTILFCEHCVICSDPDNS